jgi:hypothetical protein
VQQCATSTSCSPTTTKQAFVKDPRARTFKELVMAAERCPVRIITRDTASPKEKDLAKWVERAAPFN